MLRRREKLQKALQRLLTESRGQKSVMTVAAHSRRLVAACALALGLVAGPVAAQNSEADGSLDERWDLVDRYCLECHNFEDWAGGLDLEGMAPDTVTEHPAVFEQVIRKLRGRLMPPPGNDRPANAELDRLVAALEETLDSHAREQGPQPGSVAIHRLNRTEYANEIERLFGLEVDASQYLPPDTRSEGFENVAAVLQVSPTYLEQYISAARAVSIRAVGEQSPKATQTTYQAPDRIGQDDHVDGLPLGTRGGFVAEHYFPSTGEYEISVRLSSAEGSLLRSYPTGWLEYEHTLIVTLDGEEVFRDSVGGEEDLKAVDQRQQQAVVEIQERFQDIGITAPAGQHRVGVAFVAKTFAESDRKLEHTLPGLGMDSIPLVMDMKVTGPFSPQGVDRTLSREAIFSCYPDNAGEEDSCARQIIQELGRQAFRRPLREDDITTLWAFYESGKRQGVFETGIQKSLMAMLSSPKFLYRVNEVPADAEPGSVVPLTDFELASRLSFFLWSQGPDEELLSLAESGALREADTLRRQIVRMLADPRSSSLVENFALQWLKADGIDSIDPDPRIFPEFDTTLRQALKEELALFVGSILREDRRVLDLLDAEHTFVNERLARHYGIADVRGDRFRKVTLEDSRRHGLLGKGGVLMLTSYPNRTSPVLRGAYVLETFIGAPPAAPPPEVETDLEDAHGATPTTVRERLEVHRENPSCNQCHGVIDPLGLALENFNAIGKWRDKDRWADRPIDATGQLVGGAPISGPDDLRQALLDRPEQFVQTFTEKLMIYALGRAVEHHDMPVVREVVDKAGQHDYRFSVLVEEIVGSAPFQMKRVPDVQEEGQDLSLNE